MARIARSHGADVIHCHHYSPFVYGALSRVWRPHSRVVFTEHGRLSDAKPSRKRRAVNQLFARVPSAVFTVSGDLRQHLVEEGFPADAVSVIYNGIEVGVLPGELARADVRRRLGVEDEGALVIGTIARLDPVKDLGTLIRAVSELSRHVAATLVVVGDGSERAALETLVRDLGVSDRVRIPGSAGRCEGVAGGVRRVCEQLDQRRRVAHDSRGDGGGLAGHRHARRWYPEVVDASCGRLVPPREPREIDDRPPGAVA